VRTKILLALVVAASLATAVAVFLVAGSQPGSRSQMAAAANCQLVADSRAQYSSEWSHATVQRAFATTLGEVEAWDRARTGRGDQFTAARFDRFRHDAVSVCFISGLEIASRAPTNFRSTAIVLLPSGATVGDFESFHRTIHAPPLGTTDKVPVRVSEGAQI
jgi:hypothetical protein